MAEDDKSKKPAEDDAARNAPAGPSAADDAAGPRDEDETAETGPASGTPVADRDVRDPDSDLPGDARDPLTGPDRPAAGSDPDAAPEPGGTASAPDAETSPEPGDDATARPTDADIAAEDPSLFAAGAPVREEADTTLAGHDAAHGSGDSLQDDPASRDTLAAASDPDTLSGPAAAGTDTGPATAAGGAALASAGSRPVVERRGGFGSAFLGGVVAAIGGFLLAQYTGPTGWPFANDAGDAAFEEETRAALEQTQSGLDALTGRIGGVETGLGEIDLSSVETSVADLAERTTILGGELAEVQARLDEMAAEIESMGGDLSDAAMSSTDLGERLTALEKRPVEESVSPEAIAAYEREIAALQAAVEEQRAAVETSLQDQGAALEQALADQRASLDEMIAEQRAALEAERAEVEQMVAEAQAAEQDATLQAQAAQLRAAMAELVTAVDNGEPYAEELAPIAESDLDVPEALSAPAESGVATQAELVESYPPAARDALAAARSQPEEGGNRLTGFLQGQLNVRSVTPREGDDVDAVLSRAEAALRGGDVAAALEELAALPEEARSAMAGWIDRARARTDAVAAARGLSQQLNQE
ncbi:COG4223 family protein [Roseivivax sp. CAU 1761]